MMINFAARSSGFVCCSILLLLIGLCVRVGAAQSPASPAPQKEWDFAVSGDSRNCGDVVMPSIARDAARERAQFYWHLGDLRAIYDFDQDMTRRTGARPMSISEYENRAWQDFIENQINAFTIPFFLGIGNHETIPPKSRSEFIIQFADWLDSPVLREQRLRDDPNDHRLRAYFHWVQGGVDFVYLDNGTTDQFDAVQMSWLLKVLARAETDPAIKSVVVGMHQALPDSISLGHSMSDYPNGVVSGRAVYRRLLDVQNRGHKNVYVLASHSHFYMEGIFDTEYWRANGGVLPGWIVGTAGAMRYALPAGSDKARAAKTNVYGYLLGKVQRSGSIDFEFRELREGDTPPEVTTRLGADLVHQCFTGNTQVPPNPQ